MATSHTLYRPEGDLTAITTAAVTGATFVAISADKINNLALSGTVQVATAATGGVVLGVARQDAPSGGLVQVVHENGNVLEVTADGAITAGDEVQVGTAGKAATKSTGRAVGLAIATAADGDLALIRIYGTTV